MVTCYTIGILFCLRIIFKPFQINACLDCVFCEGSKEMAQWWQHLPPTGGSVPAFCRVWVEFVVGSCLALSVFLHVLQFSSLSKSNISKLQFHKGRGPTWKPANQALCGFVSKYCNLFTGMYFIKVELWSHFTHKVQLTNIMYHIHLYLLLLIVVFHKFTNPVCLLGSFHMSHTNFLSHHSSCTIPLPPFLVCSENIWLMLS